MDNLINCAHLLDFVLNNSYLHCIVNTHYFKDHYLSSAGIFTGKGGELVNSGHVKLIQRVGLFVLTVPMVYDLRI